MYTEGTDELLGCGMHQLSLSRELTRRERLVGRSGLGVLNFGIGKESVTRRIDPSSLESPFEFGQTSSDLCRCPWMWLGIQPHLKRSDGRLRHIRSRSLWGAS